MTTPAIHRPTDDEIARNRRIVDGLRRLYDGEEVPEAVLDAAGLELPPDLRPVDPAAAAADRERLSRVMPAEMAADPATPFPSVRERRDRAAAAIRKAPEVSDRVISAWTGVCRATVSRIRRSLVAAGRVPDMKARKGRDEKVYKKLPERKEEAS